MSLTENSSNSGQNHIHSGDPEIKKLQRVLRKLGYFQAGIDGVFGPKTRNAVTEFQLNQGIIRDANDVNAGTVTHETRLAIRNILESEDGQNGRSGTSPEKTPEATRQQKISKLPQLLTILDKDPKIEVVSFDLVDTLIYSRSGYFGRRERYFQKASAILRRNKIPVTVQEFKEIRGYQNKDHQVIDGVLYQMRKQNAPGRELKTTDIAKEIIRKACAKKKIKTPSGKELESMAREIEDAFAETELESMALMPGARETLEEIKKRGKKIVLVSNLEESKKQVLRYLTRLGIVHYFSGIHVSSEEGYAKSKQGNEFFKKMLRDAGGKGGPVDGKKVIHVGDNFRTDVEGSGLAGIRGIHYEEDPQQKAGRREERKRPLVEQQGKDLLEQRKKMIQDKMALEGIPESERQEMQQMSERMYELARDYYGPASMGFAVDLLKSLEKNPDQLNLCVGLDALAMFTLQKKLLRECSSHFSGIDHERIQYAPLSRKLIGSRRSSVKEWQTRMRIERPEINTFDVDKIRRFLKAGGVDKYQKINVIDHSLEGTTQDKLEELYPENDIHGMYLVSKTKGPDKRKKSGYFVGKNLPTPGDKANVRFDMYNQSQLFGDRYRDMAEMSHVWLIEFFFNGIQTSGEFFTGEEGKLRPKTNQRKLGRTLKEKKQKILRLAALHGMIDAVKLYGESVLRETREQRIMRIDKFYHWLNQIAPPDSKERTPVDEKLYKILFTRNENIKHKNVPPGREVVARKSRATPPNSPEAKLDKLKNKGNYVPLDLSVREHGNGDAAGGYCNEKKFTKDDPRLKEIQSPDGYLIGVGAGTIWSLIQFFPKLENLKGIVAFDIDPAVVLFGLTVVELAKKGIDRDEMICYLFGGTMSREIEIDNAVLDRSEQDYLTIVSSVIEKQQNPELRKKFEETLLPPKNLNQFDSELKQTAANGFLLFDRNKRRDRYFHTHGKRRVRLQEERNKLNIAHVLYKEWDKIVALAKEGKINFLHASFKDIKTFKLIQDQIPDIGDSNNIIYTSNAVGSRYVPDANELDKVCNAKRKSVYVSTTRKPDEYRLKATKEAPKL